MGEKFFTVSYTSLSVFLIFHFKQVRREEGRKVVIEPVFSVDKDFKTQLCL